MSQSYLSSLVQSTTAELQLVWNLLMTIIWDCRWSPGITLTFEYSLILTLPLFPHYVTRNVTRNYIYRRAWENGFKYVDPRQDHPHLKGWGLCWKRPF